jgi:Thermostable hemolysin
LLDQPVLHTAPGISAALPPERPACRPRGAGLRLAVADNGSHERAELEAFVGDAFARKHDATVTSFMPTLLSFRDHAGMLRGAVGLRSAADEALYLESYLDRPIESAIESATGHGVHRRTVVEVGNLASINCRAAVRMVALLPAHLLARDFQWIVFTATSVVREILLGFGAPLVELAHAESVRVARGPDRWGRYYETDPRVFAGFLPDSHRVRGFRTVEHGH